MLVAKDVVLTFNPPAGSDFGALAGAGHVKGSKACRKSKAPATSFAVPRMLRDVVDSRGGA